MKVQKVEQPETVAAGAVEVKRREQRTQREESGGERGRDTIELDVERLLRGSDNVVCSGRQSASRFDGWNRSK